MALLLSGWNEDSGVTNVLQNERVLVKKMLIDNFKIKSENILTVTWEDKETTTRERLLSEVSKVKEQLKTRKGNFLFYFICSSEAELEDIIILKHFQLGDNPDDNITHEELKDRLGEIQALNKLFIIDTECSGSVDLLSQEEDGNVLQWSSTQKHQHNYHSSAQNILYFNRALRDVLSHHECDHISCRNLPQEAFISITDLNDCVTAHLCQQTPNLTFIRASRPKYTFPLIAKLN